MKNAMTLRTMVMDNALTLGRLSKETLGKEDYTTLSTLYRNALDALTDWAGKDYAHTSDKSDIDNAFTAIKAILELFATDENRIIIDQSSMRTMRDCATKPKRLYSAEYTRASKALKEAQKTFDARAEDLLTLGCPEREENETVADYATRIRALNKNTVMGAIDVLKLYETASGILDVKTLAVDNIKKAGNWTWRRPVAVDLNTFADLIENYIADCLMDGYNLKSSATVRAERAAARAEKKDGVVAK